MGEASGAVTVSAAWARRGVGEGWGWVGGVREREFAWKKERAKKVREGAWQLLLLTVGPRVPRGDHNGDATDACRSIAQVAGLDVGVGAVC